MTTQTLSRADLEAERRRLSPAAAAGDPDALQRVRAIAVQLAQLEESEELAALAAVEQQRLDAEAAAEQREARRAAIRAQAAALRGQLAEKYAAIETAMAGLLREIDAVQTVAVLLTDLQAAYGDGVRREYLPVDRFIHGDLVNYLAGALGEHWALAPLGWGPPVKLTDQLEKLPPL